MNKFEWEFKKRNFKQKVVNGFNDSVIFVENHKEAIAGAAAVIGVVTPIVKGIRKRNNLKQEKELKDRYIYDRKVGHYIKIKRPLRNHEVIELERRKANGELLATILSDMRLL